MGTAAAIVLAAVLVWAAVAKLGDRLGTAAAFSGMGLPGGDALAIAVPAVELAVAVTLLASRRAGGVAAAVLMVAMTAVLARHRDAPCPCFGSRRTRPTGRADVVRNVVLLALAVAAVTVS